MHQLGRYSNTCVQQLEKHAQFVCCFSGIFWAQVKELVHLTLKLHVFVNHGFSYRLQLANSEWWTAGSLVLVTP